MEAVAETGTAERDIEMSESYEKSKAERNRLYEKKLKVDAMFEAADQKMRELGRIEIIDSVEAEELTPYQVVRMIAWMKSALPGEIPPEVLIDEPLEPKRKVRVGEQKSAEVKDETAKKNVRKKTTVVNEMHEKKEEEKHHEE